MHVFGPSTTGPAWLLAMASTIPFITTTESPTAQKLLVFALAAEGLRYWGTMPRCGSRVIPSNVVTTGTSQRQPLVTCGRGIAEPHYEPQIVHWIVKEEGAAGADVMAAKAEMGQGHGEAGAGPARSVTLLSSATCNNSKSINGTGILTTPERRSGVSDAASRCNQK